MASQGPVHRVQSAVEVYGYPQGHLGHMTAEEERALAQFKTLLQEKGLWAPKSDSDEFGTHDEATLLRFLRARRFVAAEAYKQFKETEDWRNANQLDLLYRTIDLEHYEETRKLYPQWTGRRDRRGIPVYVYEVKHLNSKTMAAYEKSSINTKTKAQTDGKTSPKLLRLFALYENLVRFVMPMCTALQDRQYAETPITQSNNIVDISGVGLKQFWNLRAHMQDASQLATAHYPETLDRIFIIGAPSFFPTVWGWIKRWFDPITTSKIFIISQHEVEKTLHEFIDPANIPKKYGGQLDYEFGGMPVLDPAYKEHIEWEGTYTDFPAGPLYWHDRGDHIELEAVGSVNGKERSEMVCKMRKPTLYHVLSEKQNLPAALPSAKPALRPELLSAPTEKEEVPTLKENAPLPNGHVVDSSAPTAAPVVTSDAKVVQDGEVVPATRPEPVTFVTAPEGIQALPLKDGANDQPTTVNGRPVGSHSTLQYVNPAAMGLSSKLDLDPKDITPRASLDRDAHVRRTESRSTTASTTNRSTKSRTSVKGLTKKLVNKLKH